MIMKGKISYKGKVCDYDCSTGLALSAVKSYVSAKPDDNINTVNSFFKKGLRGTPASPRYPFLIEHWKSLRMPRSRYKKDPVSIYDGSWTLKEYAVSGEWSNGNHNSNLPVFVRHIRKKGFSVGGYRFPQDLSKVGYNIIDITGNTLLQQLRDDLFNKNKYVVNMIYSLIPSGSFNNVMNDKGTVLNNILKTPEYILFSSDTPNVTFGKYTIADLRTVIDEAIQEIDQSDLSEEIKEECRRKLEELRERTGENRNRDTQNNQHVQDVIDEIKDKVLGENCNAENKIINKLNKIKNVFLQQVFTAYLSGVYIDEQKVLVLFLNNILGKTEGNTQFFKDEIYPSYALGKILLKIERTYVHELFHLIHYTQEWELAYGDYGYEVIIEGMAYYFETKYSEKYRGTSAKSDLDFLKYDYSVLSYPYVGACYIEDENGNNRFEEIVHKSLKPKNEYPHLALHSLLQGTNELEEIIAELKK